MFKRHCGDIQLSDELPEHLKMKLLKKWMNQQIRKTSETTSVEQVDLEKLVWEKLSDDRARELMEKAKQLYPDKYRLALQVFYELIRSGSIEEFDGYTTLLILHRLGIPVKPDVRIRFVKHGKEVSMRDYLE